MSAEGQRIYLLRDVWYKGEKIPRGTLGYVAEAYPTACAVDLLIPDTALVGDHRIASVVLENIAFAVFADPRTSRSFAAETAIRLQDEFAESGRDLCRY